MFYMELLGEGLKGKQLELTVTSWAFGSFVLPAREPGLRFFGVSSEREARALKY